MAQVIRYISATGNNSNDGLSKSKAWETLNQSLFYSANTGAAGASSTTPSRIYLERGSVFDSELKLFKWFDAGISSVATYIEPYGSGDKPVIDRNGTGNCILMTGVSQLSIEDITCRNAYIGISIESYTGIGNRFDHSTVSGCTIHGITGSPIGEGNGIYWGYESLSTGISDSNMIRDNLIYDCESHGIFSVGAASTEYKANSIYGCDGAGLKLRNNDITGSSDTRDNFIWKCNDGIHISTGLNSASNHIDRKIYGNIIHSCDRYGINISNDTGGVHVAGNYIIYNNIVTMTGVGVANLNIGWADDNAAMAFTGYIFNNTLYSDSLTGYCLRVALRKEDDCDIRNNLFAAHNGSRFINLSATGILHKITGSSNFYNYTHTGWTADSTGMDLVAWSGAYGVDLTGSTTAGTSPIVGFIGFPPTGSNIASLAPYSDATGASVNGVFTTDLYGTTRTIPWSFGAIEIDTTYFDPRVLSGESSNYSRVRYGSTAALNRPNTDGNVNTR